MENEQTGQPHQVRLPGFEEPEAATRPTYTSHSDYDGPAGYWARARHSRTDGIRSARRASTWTAAALIAGVAVATGYLAYAIPTSGTGTGQHSSSGVHASTAPTAPASPVVTSGGSGAGGGGDN